MARGASVGNAHDDPPLTKWALRRGTPLPPAGKPPIGEPVGAGATIWDDVAGLYGAEGSPFGAFARRIVERAGLSAGESALDLGCGNGLGLVPAAARVAPGPVVGVDSSQPMLLEARARVHQAGAGNVALVRADCRVLPWPDASFDVALASSVLQFVGSSIEVLREWRRVLRPGGRLACSVPRPSGGLQLPAAAIAEFFPRLDPDDRRRLLPVPPSRPPNLQALCRKAGFKEADASLEEFPLTFPSREAWWDLQWSHGIRALLEQIDPRLLPDFKAAVFDRLAPRCLESGELHCSAEFTVVVART